MSDGDRIPKVLVVDDEPNIRELVEVALKFHGCAVAVGASGKDALHQVGAYEPDLMILDVMLPDMDGFEVCRTLRSEGNDVPVIFLTARDTTSDTIRGLVQCVLAAGADGHRAAVELQRDLDELTDVRLVVDNEHLGDSVTV